MQKRLDSKFYAVFDEVYLTKWISVIATGLHVVHLFWACIAINPNEHIPTLNFSVPLIFQYLAILFLFPFHGTKSERYNKLTISHISNQWTNTDTFFFVGEIHCAVERNPMRRAVWRNLGAMKGELTLLDSSEEN